jgi:hypothetical protein
MPAYVSLRTGPLISDVSTKSEIAAQHTMPMDRMYAESDIITATLRGSTSVGCDDV